MTMMSTMLSTKDRKRVARRKARHDGKRQLPRVVEAQLAEVEEERRDLEAEMMDEIFADSIRQFLEDELERSPQVHETPAALALA